MCASKTITVPPSDDCDVQFRRAVEELAGFEGEKILMLEKGRYLFRKSSSFAGKLPVSNTVIREDQQIKHIGIMLKNISRLTIAGNGAALVFDGDMSAMALINCQQIRLENFSIGYLRPRVSEMQVIECDGSSVTYAVNPDSTWQTGEDGKFHWINADGIPEELISIHQVVQVASPGNKSNLRTAFNPVREAVGFEVAGENTVRFHYPDIPPVKVGETWQFRDPSRRENGIMIVNCRQVELDSLHLGFTPGLGIVAQMTRDITISNHRHAPFAGSKRVCAALADCIQISSCYGKVEIGSSFFSGSQDDPINIHGTYLGLEKVNGREIFVKFCHQETWGFLAFQPGDEVCPVKRSNLSRRESRKVVEAELLDDTTIRLLLDREFILDSAPENFVVENLSANPDVFVHDCIFECYPTRGLLLSSAGKCRVMNNEFRQTAARPAIFIAGDANSWFESGGVRDVEITGNVFRNYTAAAIEINPHIAPDGTAVHRNIRIKNNIFENNEVPSLRYHSAEDVISDLAEDEIERI